MTWVYRPARNIRKAFSYGCFLILMLTLSGVHALQDAEPAIRAGHAGSIGFRYLWIEVLKETGLDIELLAAPQQRKRKMFSSGMILLDCCSTPEWRAMPEEQAVQLFSAVLYETKEHYVFRRGAVQPIPNVEDLRRFRVAAVRGFSYPFEDLFGTKVVGRNIDDVMGLVDAGRAHVAIVSKIDFLRSMRRVPRQLELGGVNMRAKLRARVHRSRADLLPSLNAAIERLRVEGRIEELVLQSINAPLSE